MVKESRDCCHLSRTQKTAKLVVAQRPNSKAGDVQKKKPSAKLVKVMDTTEMLFKLEVEKIGGTNYVGVKC